MSSLSIGHGRPTEGRGRGNHPRQSSSNVYNSFDPSQIKTFKEAFNVRLAACLELSGDDCLRDFLPYLLQMIDDDHNGEISENDLTKVLQQLGALPRARWTDYTDIYATRCRLQRISANGIELLRSIGQQPHDQLHDLSHNGLSSSPLPHPCNTRLTSGSSRITFFRSTPKTRC